jgi:hypothetical protein
MVKRGKNVVTWRASFRWLGSTVSARWDLAHWAGFFAGFLLVIVFAPRLVSARSGSST